MSLELDSERRKGVMSPIVGSGKSLLMSVELIIHFAFPVQYCSLLYFLSNLTDFFQVNENYIYTIKVEKFLF